MIRIELETDLKSSFTKIALISKESMIEQSSKAGNKVRVNARASLTGSRTNWRQSYKRVRANKTAGGYDREGRKLIKGFPQSTGKRIAHRKGGGLDDPANMANFITAKTFESTGTTIIGGAHKRFTPVKIRNGKVVGRTASVGAVDKRTIAILNKLNSGKAGQHLRWRTKNGGYSSDSIAEFEGKWKARHFMEKGYSMSRGYIKSSMTSELERLIGKRVNSMKTKKETHVA